MVVERAERMAKNRAQVASGRRRQHNLRRRAACGTAAAGRPHQMLRSGGSKWECSRG